MNAITVIIISLLLSGCGPIQATKIEEMNDNERELFLETQSNEQLCKKNNNYFIKPQTEIQIATILSERGVDVCNALSETRIIQKKSKNKNSDYSYLETNKYKNDRQFKKKEKYSDFTFVESLKYEPTAKYLQDVISLISFKKDSMETTKEFLDRKLLTFDKFNHKAYKIVYLIDNKDNNHAYMVSYEPDNSKLLIRFPKKITSKNYLFLSIKSINNSDSYVGSNYFGAKVPVVKIRETNIGLAVVKDIENVNEADNIVSIHMDRELAKSVLSNGTIELNVYIDYSYMNFDKDEHLVNDLDIMTPSVKYPLDYFVKYFGFPVRLVSVKINDSNNKTVKVLNELNFSINSTK